MLNQRGPYPACDMSVRSRCPRRPQPETTSCLASGFVRSGRLAGAPGVHILALPREISTSVRWWPLTRRSQPNPEIRSGSGTSHAQQTSSSISLSQPQRSRQSLEGQTSPLTVHHPSLMRAELTYGLKLNEGRVEDQGRWTSDIYIRKKRKVSERVS